MYFGNSLFQARKRSGLSQEGVAEKLGVSRQTVSKWETGETVPDIYQSKKMARLYGVSLDELIDFDADVREIQEAIEKTKAETEEKIDWTSAWGKKYPVLLQYRGQVAAEGYARQLSEMLDALKREYAYSEQDAMLVLKDILYRVWKSRKEKKSGCPPAAQAGKGGRFCPFGGGAQRALRARFLSVRIRRKSAEISAKPTENLVEHIFCLWRSGIVHLKTVW